MMDILSNKIVILDYVHVWKGSFSPKVWEAMVGDLFANRGP